VADAALAADLERSCALHSSAGTWWLSPASLPQLSGSQHLTRVWLFRSVPILGVEARDLMSAAGVSLNVEAKLRRIDSGAEWLLARARNGLGALFADEMGLEKTVQTAMIECLQGTTLVVCPSRLSGTGDGGITSAGAYRAHDTDREKRFGSILLPSGITVRPPQADIGAIRVNFSGRADGPTYQEPGQPERQGLLRSAQPLHPYWPPVEYPCATSGRSSISPARLSWRQDFKERYETL
jgi:hypothetical protein